MKRLLFDLFVLMNAFQGLLGDEHSHVYTPGEEVVLWMSSTGPYANSAESYSYYSLPFCRGPLKGISHEHENIGEALLGYINEFSGLEIKFKENRVNKEFCALDVGKKEVKALGYAVRNGYSYSMVLDDLPIIGIIGDIEDDLYYIWTHKKLEIGFSGNQIIDINFTSENRVLLQEGTRLGFSYEVIWKESDIEFDNRFDRYLDTNFFQHRIHWFSIFNSFMMVLFLIGLVALILARTLSKDLARYSREVDEMEAELVNEYGWKQVHGDVFRGPLHGRIFSALIGNGAQIGVVVFILIVWASVFGIDHERGSLLSKFILFYSLSSPVNGFISNSTLLQLDPKFNTSWIRFSIFSALALPILFLSTSLALHLIFSPFRALSMTSLASLIGILIFVFLPLSIFGSILGRNWGPVANYPTRINAVPRPIPQSKFSPRLIAFLGGLLPFGSIFIEMYFVLISFWGYKNVYIIGFSGLVFGILVILTICVNIVCVYFLLNAEDYRWHWTSFFAGSSTSVYIYLYSIYFFFFKTKMFGAFQTVFYFSYMALFCISLGILTGALGYLGSSLFVKKIYSNVKID